MKPNAKNLPIDQYPIDFDFVTKFGNFVKVNDPTLTNIDMAEIKHYVCNMKRYNSAEDIYLVQHLSACCELAALHPDVVYYTGYFGTHDFAEYILGDIVNGLKSKLTYYKETLEPKWEEYIHAEIGLPLAYLPSDIKDYIKHIDLLTLAVEMKRMDWPAYEWVIHSLGYEDTQIQTISKVINSYNMSVEECWQTIEKAISHTKCLIRRNIGHD